MTSLANSIIKYRLIIILIFVLLAFVFAAQLSRVEIDSDMKSQLKKTLTSRLNTELIDELLGGTEMIMVLVRNDDVLANETIERVKAI